MLWPVTYSAVSLLGFGDERFVVDCYEPNRLLCRVAQLTEQNLNPERPIGDLRGRDALLLLLFSMALFGYSAFWGQALTLHEARLPQLAREMMRTHDWLIPRSGGRPWLERPPLPHWIEIAFSEILGRHCDKIWVVRLPAAMMGAMTVVLLGWTAARLFGRRIGIVSALVLATMFEFWRYSTLAEDDIFLAMLVALAMALFTASQWPGSPSLPARDTILSHRPWQVMTFFIVAGLTNLVKGPLVGLAFIGISIGGFLVFNWQERPWRRYFWFFGILACLALTLYWPVAVVRRFPSILDNWYFDYDATTQYDEKFWYYLAQMGLLLPWIPAAILGLAITLWQALFQRGSAQRFLWCWAILPLVLLSLAHRKHHHYLLPCVAPWAVLSALGLRTIAQTMFRGSIWSRHPVFGMAVFGLPGAAAIVIFRARIPGGMAGAPLLSVVWLSCVLAFYVGLWKQRAAFLLAAVVVGTGVAFCWGQTFVPDSKARMAAQDVDFLCQADAIALPGDLLAVNAAIHGELYFFREQFYLRPQALLLHNLTFLRDQRLSGIQYAYVVSWDEDQSKLQQIGQVVVVGQSDAIHSRKGKDSANRLTLFLVEFAADMERYEAPSANRITAKQAMGREPGPFCGPPLIAPAALPVAHGVSDTSAQ